MRKLIIILILISLCGCDARKPPFDSGDRRPVILVFAAMAVADPVARLVTEFNKSSDCRAQAVYGGSSHIRRAVEVSQKGDVFFPGIGTYVDDMEDRGLISTKFNVGYYRISMYVRKGNPLKITDDLSNLYNRELRVGIGDYVSSGIGRSTKAMLTAAGIYDKVQQNSVFMASDSMELLNSVVSGRTDVVLDWANLIHYGTYKDHVDQIEIKSPHFQKVPLTAGILKYTTDRACSEKFVRLLSSKKGRDVFAGYGMAGEK